MDKEYGKKKGDSVFYASANKGKIKNVHEDCEISPEMKKLRDAFAKKLGQ